MKFILFCFLIWSCCGFTLNSVPAKMMESGSSQTSEASSKKINFLPKEGTEKTLGFSVKSMDKTNFRPENKTNLAGLVSSTKNKGVKSSKDNPPIYSPKKLQKRKNKFWSIIGFILGILTGILVAAITFVFIVLFNLDTDFLDRDKPKDATFKKYFWWGLKWSLFITNIVLWVSLIVLLLALVYIFMGLVLFIVAVAFVVLLLLLMLWLSNKISGLFNRL